MKNHTIKPGDVYPALKAFSPHEHCGGHKISYLEDPMTTGVDRLLMLKILSNYWPDD